MITFILAPPSVISWLQLPRNFSIVDNRGIMGLRRKNSGKATKSREKQQQVDDYQPTILKKREIPKIIVTLAENDEKKENVGEQLKMVKVQTPVMKHSVSMISKNHTDSVLLLENLDLENNNFYVVGAIGMKDSGKSTLLNLIATGEIHRCKVFSKPSLQAPLFSDFPSGNGVEGFITKNRVFLLDSAPVLHNTRFREFIISEADTTDRFSHCSACVMSWWLSLNRNRSWVWSDCWFALSTCWYPTDAKTRKFF